MTWPVRSRLLHQEVQAAPGVNVVHYSGFVPAGKTWLLKDITVWSGGGASQNAYVYSVTGAVLTVVASYLGLISGAAGLGLGRSIVIPAGSRLAWSVSANTLVHVTLSGAQLG